jgi:hypothetical protein
MQLASKTNVKIQCLSFRSPISDPNPISRKSLLLYSLYLGLTCIVCGFSIGDMLYVGTYIHIWVQIYTEVPRLGEEYTCEQAVFVHRG